MVEFDCKYHIAHEQELSRHDGDIKDLKDDVIDLKISQKEVNVKFVTFMESMSELPHILDGFKEAILENGYEIKGIKDNINEIKASQSKNDESMTIKVNRIEDDVKTVDEKDKVSILTFVKDNLWKILVAIASLVVAYKEFF